MAESPAKKVEPANAADEQAMLDEIEASFEKIASDPQALAAYRAESDEIEAGFEAGPRVVAARPHRADLQAELSRIEASLPRNLGKLDSLALICFQSSRNLLGGNQLVKKLYQDSRYLLSVAERARHDATRVSRRRRVTIPAVPFREAGFKPGDILRVEADGAGRVILTRIEELVNRYSGCLDTGGTLRNRAKHLREEWR